MSYAVFAQGPGGVEISKDAKSGYLMWRGDFSFNDLNNEKSFDWFRDGVKNYKPNKNALKVLRQKLPDYKLVIAIGTWCSDSHTMIPGLYTVLELCSFSPQNVYMFGVNRDKESLNADSKLYHIKNAPTVIVYKGNQEIGRIIETAHTTIEDDLLEIISKDTPNR
jgi:hypothetical protein